MADTTIIPAKINVGFQKRSDTYTGQLGYIIYYDHKGVLRKESSWQSWRDRSIPNLEFDNVPTEGFVLNKKAGGGRGWDSRRTVSRIYDPRGFEFEIGIDNLLYILENTNCIKGKGLEGRFVYGWSGNTLLLIPESAPEFTACAEFTAALAGRVEANDLVVGATYRTKGNEQVVYMGRFDYHTEKYNTTERRYELVNKKKHYFFMSPVAPYKITHLKALDDKIIQRVGTELAYNFAELMELVERDVSYSPYDPSKDVYEAATKEDIETAGYPWVQQFYVPCGEDRVRVSLSELRDKDVYVLEQANSGFDLMDKLNQIIPIPDNYLWKYRIQVSIDTILNTFNLLIKREFLQNGKQKR